MAKKIKGKRRSDIRTEHEFRPGGLAPRKGYQKDGIAWSGAFRKLMTTMRDTGRRSEARSVRPVRDRIFHQRVAIRVRYSKRGSKGQWKAHGRYIERESAGKGGFNEEGAVKPSKKLNEWQDPGDELMWKIIISPERGNELDLEAFTKDLLAHMDRDLGLQLEWTAAVHTNTAHHHVHLVIRGVDKGGKEVKLPAEYVRQGIRHRAQELATAKLGHRLDYDIILAQMKMVDQTRFTDLDRAILKNVPDGQSYINPTLSTGVQQATEALCNDRLAFLGSIGLAEKVSEFSWRVEPDLERALRALGQAHDRQRTMDQFGVTASDPATPIHVTTWREIDSFEGRILVHGQEDQKERAYMLIEDVNGVIRFMEHRKEIEDARAAGLLQPGSYVAMRVRFIGPKQHWLINDYGPAEEAVNNPEFVQRCISRGVNPNHAFGGWLGRFRDAVKGSGIAPKKSRRRGRRA